MQNENTVAGNQTPEQPSPQIQVTPGLQTSSGQFTAIFGLVSVIMSLVGYKYSPAQIENWVELVNNFVIILGPFIAFIPVLMSYITSRGKIASNTVKANAVILAPPVIAPLATGQTGEFISGTLSSLPSKIGGADWKDPKRYGNIIDIAAALGVPGVVEADKFNDKYHIDDILGSILDKVRDR
jgi:hypothetical protein